MLITPNCLECTPNPIIKSKLDLLWVLEKTGDKTYSSRFVKRNLLTKPWFLLGASATTLLWTFSSVNKSKVLSGTSSTANNHTFTYRNALNTSTMCRWTNVEET